MEEKLLELLKIPEKKKKYLFILLEFKFWDGYYTALRVRNIREYSYKSLRDNLEKEVKELLVKLSNKNEKKK